MGKSRELVVKMGTSRVLGGVAKVVYVTVNKRSVELVGGFDQRTRGGV